MNWQKGVAIVLWALGMILWLVAFGLEVTGYSDFDADDKVALVWILLCGLVCWTVGND